jgi:hypothetical protein
MPDQAPNIDLEPGQRGRLVYDKTRRTIVTQTTETTNHTPGPWVGFSDRSKCVAIMPAGREGDVCTFNQPPSEADARLLVAAPDLLAALYNVRQIISEGAMEGFNPLAGDWAERLFASQGITSTAIKKAAFRAR